MKENKLLLDLREGRPLGFWQQIALIIQLSIPAVFANISQVLMEYIDSSMVGQLGAGGSAAIGLVASSTWLMGGLLYAVSTGFAVQVAQRIGAGDDRKARDLVHEGLIIALVWALILAAIGMVIGGRLPGWLGGSPEILWDASWYFRIYAMSAPMIILVNICGAFIQASGNMIIPSVLHILMCLLDVVFNNFWIFQTRQVSIFGTNITVYGAGLGVRGAAIGTLCAEICVGFFLLIYLLHRSPALKKRKAEKRKFDLEDIKRAARIGIPVGIEQTIQCGAQVVSTTIVSPLGTAAIAANSLAVTAEGLCYMPGYGIQAAAQTLIGQSIGAKRKDLVRRLAFLTTGFGTFIMIGSGLFMYYAAPLMMGFLTPDPEVRALGILVLRIEAFAEAFFGVSIVANGAFRGAGDTLIPSIMGLITMWCIRLPLAWFLSRRIGLQGVWMAMAIELTFRGVIFFARLCGKRWMKVIQ